MKQLITLLYLNKNITTSEGIFKHQIEILQELKNRIERHIDYYNTNELVQSNLKLVNCKSKFQSVIQR